MSNANEPDQVNTGALATTIGIVALATLGIALFVTSLVREESRVLGDERQGTQDRAVRELRVDQLGVLQATPTWKDRAKGIVTLPIEHAMDWMVEAVRKDPKALSPWQPPAPQGLGGAGPEASSEQNGTGGTAATPEEEVTGAAPETKPASPSRAAGPVGAAPAPAAAAPAPAAATPAPAAGAH